MSLFSTVLMSTFGGSTPPTPVAYTSWEVTVPSGGGTYGIFVIGTVDWGDGSATSTGTAIGTEITHNYSTGGTYIVTVSGYNHRIAHNQSNVQATNSSWVQRVLTFGTVSNAAAARIFYGCANLSSIECPFSESWTSMNFAFENCTSLTTLQYPALPNSITNSGNSNGLYHAFAGCRVLTTDVGAIFANFTASSGVRTDYAFYECRALTGTAPADKLWNGNMNNFNHAACFTNCNSLTNYADIPAGWK